MSDAVVSLLAVIALAGVHLVAGQLRVLAGTPRSVWLSMAGGVSVAYVFVQLLPELGEGQEAIAAAAGEALAFLEVHVYLLALLGLAVFYGLERAATESRRRRRAAGQGDKPSAAVFWLHVASFALYTALIGYLLRERAIEQDRLALLLFAVAMGLHFVVTDYGLREHYKADYDCLGRWLLAAALAAGWLVGLGWEVPEAARAILVAFLAGGVILNVLKEELPQERESRYWAFALGAAAYTALLLAL